MKQPLQFTTNNAALALALFIAGERPASIVNEYDDALLDRLKCRSVADAAKLKKLGKLQYFFPHTETLDALLAAYDETGRAVEAGQAVELPAVEPREAIRIVAYFVKNRGAWMDFNFHPSVTMYAASNGSATNIVDEIELDEKGNKVILSANSNHPGFTLVSLNLSAAKKAQLGL